MSVRQARRSTLTGHHRSGAAGGFPSGLPWSSGAATDTPDSFATWRGRPLDCSTTWPPRSTWAEVENCDVYGAVTGLSAFATLSIGMFAWPTSVSGTFAIVNAGTYDSHYLTYGTNLNAVRPDAIIKLMWEFNLEGNNYFIGSDTAGFIAAFQRIVTKIRVNCPTAQFMFNPNKDNHGTGAAANVANAYPGDAYVDHVGPDFYNMYPDYPDAAAWTAGLDTTQGGGPLGLNQWATFARAHGKKLSIPEWGPTVVTGVGTDSIEYIKGMYAFFSANADVIGHEVNFNVPNHLIWPRASSPAPLSSDQYQASWSAAVVAATVPAAPTGVSASGGDASATVSFTLGSDGGQTITGSTITSSPGGITGAVSGTGTTGSVSGLTNGTAYTFTVTSTNMVGVSSASSASNSVTPAVASGVSVHASSLTSFADSTGTGGTITTGAFSPPASSLIVVAFTEEDTSVTAAAAATITNTGTALTWTRAAVANRTTTATANNAATCFFWALNSSAQSNITATITPGATSADRQVTVAVLTGHNTSTPVGTSGVGISGTSATPIAYTATVTGSLGLAVAWQGFSGKTVSAGAATTLLANLVTSSATNATHARQTTNAAGLTTQTLNLTYSGATTAVYSYLEVRP